MLAPDTVLLQLGRSRWNISFRGLQLAGKFRWRDSFFFSSLSFSFPINRWCEIGSLLLFFGFKKLLYLIFSTKSLYQSPFSLPLLMELNTAWTPPSARCCSGFEFRLPQTVLHLWTNLLLLWTSVFPSAK